MAAFTHIEWQGQRMRRHETTGWLVWVGGLVVFILLPFLLYGERMSNVAQALLQSEASRWAAALALAVLLAADIVLPIPSSGVSAAIGALLGFGWGTVVSTVAMTMACIAGYGIGRYAGRAAATTLVGASELQRTEQLAQRYGHVAIVGLRGVPILSEASVIAAGAARLSRGRFLVASTIANAGISAAYTAAGVLAFETGSLALAFTAAVGVPLLALVLMRIVSSARQKSSRQEVAME
jgi:uncharacterized membrane protein YdjX (TVP38/TMEM64 family)